METNHEKTSESSYNVDLWDRLDLHLGSYIKCPLQLSYINSKTPMIGRALRRGIVDLLDNLPKSCKDYIENDTTVLGTEHRLCHSRDYTVKAKEGDIQCSGIDIDDAEEVDINISSIAPTIFAQLREYIGIPCKDFRHSFHAHSLKDFTNPGKSGSLMYKTFDELFILKTLRDYEARLLMQIISGYYLQFTQRPTLFNRYLGLYSVRLQVAFTNIEIFVVIMASAFTPSIHIDEIFDLKGSKIKRKLVGQFSVDQLYKLKDLDFMDLYPHGILVPTSVYQKLKIVIANDAKVLKKLNITDFSLILGIHHLDMTRIQMLNRQPMTTVTALLQAYNYFAPHDSIEPSDKRKKDHSTSASYPYLKPLQMLQEQIDTNLYYGDDPIAFASLPIPGMINKTNQRVYLYLAFVDMLQTFDSVKLIDQTFRKITDPGRHLEYSVIEPEDYEKRINQFLFKNVFIDAQGDLPWVEEQTNAEPASPASVVQFRL